jgi:hypothetical protein
VRGIKFFRERLRATTDNTTSSDDEFPNNDFFPEVEELFSNLNMGGNTKVAAIATANTASDVANTEPYVFLGLLEFIVLVK